MLRIIHRGIAVVTRLLVSLLEAPQVCVETVMASERLRQVKADLPVLSVLSGGELRDQTAGIKKKSFFYRQKTENQNQSFIDIITKNLYNNMKVGDKYVKIYKSESGVNLNCMILCH